MKSNKKSQEVLIRKHLSQLLTENALITEITFILRFQGASGMTGFGIYIHTSLLYRTMAQNTDFISCWGHEEGQTVQMHCRFGFISSIN